MQPLLEYTLHLADNALILGHRNSEWTGHGPVLEQDIAISNIALDLIGQARNFYQYAATMAGDDANEDTLAYLRDAWDFRNCLLAEQPNGDWAHTILRQFFFSTYQYFLYRELQLSNDTVISAIAEKSFKEVTYHLRWSSEWVIRLGDGTEESHRRMREALDQLLKYAGELLTPASYETALAGQGVAANLSLIQRPWQQKIEEVLSEAALPYAQSWVQLGGKEGRHTEHLGYILAEMQFLQRAYPGAEW